MQTRAWHGFAQVRTSAPEELGQVGCTRMHAILPNVKKASSAQRKPSKEAVFYKNKVAQGKPSTSYKGETRSCHCFSTSHRGRVRFL